MDFVTPPYRARRVLALRSRYRSQLQSRAIVAELREKALETIQRQEIEDERLGDLPTWVLRLLAFILIVAVVMVAGFVLWLMLFKPYLGWDSGPQHIQYEQFSYEVPAEPAHWNDKPTFK
jgi:hypothetical protein